MSGNYRLDGHTPVLVEDTLEWARWFETADRHVAVDVTPGGKRVSTVFLGLDHAFGGGTPLLFETMVFSGRHAVDGIQERYSTWDEAVRGHAAVLADVIAKEQRT